MKLDFFEKISEKQCNSCGNMFPLEKINSYYGKDYCSTCLKAKKAKKKQKELQKSKDLSSSSNQNNFFQQSNVIRTNIGALKVFLDNEKLDKLMNNLWEIDSLENPYLDDVLKKEFDKLALQNKMKLNIQKIFTNIEEKAFFVFKNPNTNQVEKYSFQEWQREFKKYSGVGKLFDFRRTEFSQFLNNKFKNHWVDEFNNPLKDEDFQVLVRSYRERKAMERLMQFMEENYLRYVDDQALEGFLRNMRMIICKIVKEQLIQILK